MDRRYCTKTDVENYTLQTIDPTFDTQIDAWIEAVTQYIEGVTGRVFIADAEASARLYDGDGTDTLLIDDCIEVDTLTVEETEVAEEDYWVGPANETRKYEIILKDGWFDIGTQNVEVEATWGYSEEVPADIKLAATILVAGITAHADQTGKEVRSETIGSYSVSYADKRGWEDFERVKEILTSYQKHTF
jgi:hypothetical protein